MSNFWEKLHKPLFVLAPMADVTDPAFRRVIVSKGRPDVMWTEFVSADGLARAPEEGRRKLLKDLEYSESERPIVAQFFTSNPDHMYKAAQLARELGFDGVDINMGCPDRKVEKQGAGAGLIKTPALARELIRSAKAGAGPLPLSVKTRLGYNKDELETWLPELLAEEPSAIIIHARTRKEMSKVPARWERIKRAVEIRDELGSKTLILGNGDVLDLADARQKVEVSGADGAMLGRAIFGNPWLFDPANRNVVACSRSERGIRDQQHFFLPTIPERLQTLVEHTKLFEQILGEYKSFAIMKKHFKSYVSGFDGAVELRTQLMETNNADEVAQLINKFLLDNKV